jgi:hypothetical protein
VRVGIIDFFGDDKILTYQFNVGPYPEQYPRFNSLAYDSRTFPIKDANGSLLYNHLRRYTAAQTRVIIVEDLSASVIDVLGSIWDLDPEFFIEHLEKRWDESDRWSTADLSKPYFSSRWCRSVFLNSAGAADIAQQVKDGNPVVSFNFLLYVPGLLDRFVDGLYPLLREGQSRMPRIWRRFYFQHADVDFWSGAYEEHVSIYFLDSGYSVNPNHRTGTRML